MKLFKNICLLIFAIITILFTVGYASQPIVNSSSTISTPSGSVSSVSDKTFYISYYSTTLSDIQNTYTQNTDYTSLSNNEKIVFQTLFYICIAITILLTVSIILALLGLKLVSKIVFLLVLIMMIVAFLVIQLSILTKSLVVMADTQSLSKPDVSNGTGYYLILASTVLMLVNYILYMFLA